MLFRSPNYNEENVYGVERRVGLHTWFGWSWSRLFVASCLVACCALPCLALLQLPVVSVSVYACCVLMTLSRGIYDVELLAILAA